MSYSLQSRDLIADSIETVMSAQVGRGVSGGPVVGEVGRGPGQFETALRHGWSASGRPGSLPTRPISGRRSRLIHPLPPSPPPTPPPHQWYDANISLPGCDKNMPGSLIAMARLNRCGGGRRGGAAAARGRPLRHGWRPRLDVCRRFSLGLPQPDPPPPTHTPPPPSPSIMIYGGTIKPGHSTLDGSVLDIVNAFQSYGEFDPGLTLFDSL
jgi:hypothetical protein